MFHFGDLGFIDWWPFIYIITQNFDRIRFDIWDNIEYTLITKFITMEKWVKKEKEENVLTIGHTIYGI